MKEAIDIIIKFGSALCLKTKIEKGDTGNAPFEAMVKAGEKPDWMKHIDWLIGNTGAVDCPEKYLATHPECILGGGRACLMAKAIESAKAGNCPWAFRLTLITQCQKGGSNLDRKRRARRGLQLPQNPVISPVTPSNPVVNTIGLLHCDRLSRVRVFFHPQKYSLPPIVYLNSSRLVERPTVALAQAKTPAGTLKNAGLV